MTFDPKNLSGAGMDTLEDVQRMPLLRIIQASSPEVKKTHPKYAERHVDGAEAGMITLSSTGDLFTEVEALPLAIKTIYAEWRPKQQGGGFVGHHDLDVVRDPEYRKGSPKSDYDEFLGDNELIYTMYVFLLIKVGDEWKKAVIAMKKTELKHGRLLQDMIRKFKYPETKEFKDVQPFMFSRSFIIKAQPDANDSGDWYNWNIVVGKTLELQGEDLVLLESAFQAQTDAVQSLPSAKVQKALVADEDAF